MRKISPVLLMVAGLLITAASLLWCTSLDSGTGAWPTVGRTALLGLGLGVLFTPMTAAAVAAVRHRQAGMADAGLNALRQTGGALGPAVLRALLTSSAVGSLPGALARPGVAAAGRCTRPRRSRRTQRRSSTALRRSERSRPHRVRRLDDTRVAHLLTDCGRSAHPGCRRRTSHRARASRTVPTRTYRNSRAQREHRRNASGRAGLNHASRRSQPGLQASASCS